MQFASAQASKIRVRIKLVDSTSLLPVSFAEILITGKNDTTAAKGYVDSQGSFSIEIDRHDEYVLRASAIGYATLKIPFNVLVSEMQIDLGTKLMSKDTKQLQEVTINGTRQLSKPTIEGINYDVASDPESRTANLLDIIKKVPLLSVNANDAVLMKGSSDYKIFINGRPSASMDHNAKDILKSMPANSIQRIEVISHPSSRYDAEGIGGIINIITKKYAEDGYRGSFRISDYYPYGPGINLNATVKTGKFTISENFGYGDQNTPALKNQNSQQSLLSDMTTISQNGTNKSTGYFGFNNTEFSFEIDTLNLFTASINFYRSSTKNQNLQNTNVDSPLQSLLQSYTQLNAGDGSFKTKDITFNYQAGFKRNKDAMLTASYKYLHLNNIQSNAISFTNAVNYHSADYNLDNNLGTNEQTGQIDFVYPLKNWGIEAGAKGIFRSSFSDYQNFINQNNILMPDTANSNQFTYHQDVYSVYNSYNFTLFRWSVKAGARLEITTTDANFISTATLFNQTYNNLVPSIIFQRDLSQGKNLNISYNQKIERPSIWQLNPFVDNSNHLFVSTGNINLRPSVTHNIEVTYSAYGSNSLTAGLFYNFSNNGIQYIQNNIRYIIVHPTGKCWQNQKIR